MDQRRLTGELGLVLVTVIWGSTFIITKLGLAQVSPFTFLAIRFILAFAVLMLAFGKQVFRAGRKAWLGGATIGLILFLGYATQTAGLQYTTAAKSGFITGLSVILTPILAIFILKQRASFNVIAGALLAFLGLAVMAYNPEITTGVNFGDMLTLFCALAFAFHITVVGKFAPDLHPGVFTTIQMGTAGAGFCIMSLLFEHWPTQATTWTWIGLAYMGIVATAVVLFIQNWAQKFTTASRTAIIFTLEPVFTAIFAYFILHEDFTLRTLLGGAYPQNSPPW
ncbi:MAG TPA: DMT family transporter [Bacillota bacterium]|nr:DMT family transporter [Bacillota bacterium]